MIKKTEKEIMKNWCPQEKPFVSCCCITYNHEKFIAMALDSMLIQETDFPFEIIVRDDCSTDQTAAIIKQYAKEYPNIIRPIFEKENQYSKGINGTPMVLTKARGKYIAFLEGDDYWRDEYKLQKQVDFLEKNEEYVITYHNSIIVDENNKLITESRNPIAQDYSSDQMLCDEVYILTNTVMYRNVKIDFPQNFGKILNADGVIWHLLAYHGKCKYQENIKYAAYRRHSGGVWSSLNRLQQFKKAIEFKRILRKMLILKENTRLANRLTTNIKLFVATRLFDAIYRREFALLKYIIQTVVKDEEINSFEILVLLPKVIFTKIKNKRQLT